MITNPIDTLDCCFNLAQTKTRTSSRNKVNIGYKTRRVVTINAQFVYKIIVTVNWVANIDST